TSSEYHRPYFGPTVTDALFASAGPTLPRQLATSSAGGDSPSTSPRARGCWRICPADGPARPGRRGCGAGAVPGSSSWIYADTAIIPTTRDLRARSPGEGWLLGVPDVGALGIIPRRRWILTRPERGVRGEGGVM